MLKHVVMWKLHDTACGNTREKNMNIIEKELKSLMGVVPELLSVELGRDVLHSDMSYDMALICTFKDVDAMKAYKVHPEHVKVANFIHEAMEKRVVIDYMID